MKGINTAFVGNATLRVTIDLEKIDRESAVMEVERLREEFPAKSIITIFINPEND